MMFRFNTNVLLAVLAAAAIPSNVVHAGDGTTCLVTTICDLFEPQSADCTDAKGSTFQACCPPNMFTGGDPATGTGFTCVASGAVPAKSQAAELVADAKSQAADAVAKAKSWAADAVAKYDVQNLVDGPNTADSGSTRSRPTVLAAIATLATAAVPADLW
mmetsp:Transcript_48137/g.54485  ORF Transcript_48137/g.54485 Transcript_48137/m.54485 type:complete len:160 (-) Transcript_48137:237-716(-)